MTSRACVDENTAIAFVDGVLSLEARTEVEHHLDGCDECRGVITAAMPHATSPSSDAVLAEPDVPPRYVLLDRVGSGAMGIVYSAYDRTLDRKVALKIVRGTGAGDGDARLRDRFLREGKALARLSHPNVVAAYDAGAIGTCCFIAMELVVGTSLKTWLAEEPRSVRDLLPCFKEVGRGLAAAHGAGVIHRDFKPDNVVVGRDGHARVVDFGLASLQVGGVHEEVVVASTVTASATHLTHTDAILGTPAYMAPEQMLGLADARSDQFSFSVALHEALFAARPNSAETPTQPDEAAHAGERSRSARVPRWLQRIVTRGLRANPDDRYPSMDALLADLERGSGRAGRRIAAGAVLLAAAVGGAVALSMLQSRPPQPQPQLCRGAEHALDGVWDDTTRDVVHRAFLATGLPAADAIWRHVAHDLDAYAGSWKAMRSDACEATRVRGEQSEALLDLREACLDERREDLLAMTAVLRHADAAVVEHAGQSIGALDRLDGCADTRALLERVPPPADPKARAAVDELQRRLAQAKALLDLGQIERGMPIAKACAADARALAYPPILARALVRLAEYQTATGAMKDAEDSAFDAALAAEVGRDDELAAKAWTSVAFCVAFGDHDLVRAHQWERIAEAAIDRVGKDGYQRIAFEQVAAQIALVEGDGASALKHAERADSIGTKVFTEPERPVTPIYEIGEAKLLGNDCAGAVVALERAIALIEAREGTTSRALISPLQNLGSAQLCLEHPAQALVELQRIVSIQEVTHAQEATRAQTLDLTGNTLLKLGRPVDAVAAFQQAQTILASAPKSGFVTRLAQDLATDMAEARKVAGTARPAGGGF